MVAAQKKAAPAAAPSHPPFLEMIIASRILFSLSAFPLPVVYALLVVCWYRRCRPACPSYVCHCVSLQHRLQHPSFSPTPFSHNVAQPSNARTLHRHASLIIPTMRDPAFLVPRSRRTSFQLHNFTRHRWLIQTRFFLDSYLEQKYKIEVNNSVNSQLSRSLKNGIDKGILSMPKGTRLAFRLLPLIHLTAYCRYFGEGEARTQEAQDCRRKGGSFLKVFSWLRVAR